MGRKEWFVGTGLIVVLAVIVASEHNPDLGALVAVGFETIGAPVVEPTTAIPDAFAVAASEGVAWPIGEVLSVAVVSLALGLAFDKTHRRLSES